jgi:tRNA-splicing ligase RtcB
VVAAPRRVIAKPFSADVEAVNCHHNYVQKETHFGAEVLRHPQGRGVGPAGRTRHHPRFDGRELHRPRPRQPGVVLLVQPRRRPHHEPHPGQEAVHLADQVRATAGVECRKDADVIDEIPMAYKDIDAVMAAQSELVEIVPHSLRQVVCVKG